MKYKLIHIDTLEVTLCDKITFKGNDYYVIKTDDLDMFTYYVDIIENTIEFEGDSDEVDINPNWRKVITTTNTSLQCPQVVDYVEELAESNYGTDIDSYRSSKPYDLEGDRKQGFVKGYQKHSETYNLSDEEVLEFAEYSVKNILYNDENGILIVRTYNELLTQFKSTLPAKIYYR